MAGNSQRKGAIKKTGKGNPTAGSGGRVRRGLGTGEARAACFEWQRASIPGRRRSPLLAPLTRC